MLGARRHTDWKLKDQLGATTVVWARKDGGLTPRVVVVEVIKK